MKFFRHAKDGGPESHVEGWWLIEAKGLLSVALLKFAPGSRDVFHDHAFNALSWLLRGFLLEEHTDGKCNNFVPSLLPILTKRSTCHKVYSAATSWVLTFRGPWSKYWHEVDPYTGEVTTLKQGRVPV